MARSVLTVARMRLVSLTLLTLVACQDKPTLGEQQRPDPPPKKVVAAAQPPPAGPGSAAKSASKLGKLGLQLRGAKAGDGPSWFRCDGDLCKDAFGFDPATRIATLQVEADPEVSLRVPGATLGRGATWKVDLVDLLARIRVDGMVGRELVYKMKLEVQRGNAPGVETTVSFDLSSLAETVFSAVAEGKRQPFAQDTASRFASDALLRLKKLDNGFNLEAVHPAAALGEIDFVAVEALASHVGAPCNYVDDKGNRVVKERKIADRAVTIYARRTGAVVARRTLLGTTPPCRATMHADEEMFGAVADEDVEAWERSFVRAHPGEYDAAPPDLPALGKALSPEEGGDIPSRFAPLAAKLGMRDTNPNNQQDVLDSLTGDLGEDFVALHELRAPKSPKGGSAAVAFKGDFAIAVVLRDNPDAAAAQKLLDQAVAKWPDARAMIALRPPGYEAQTDKIDDTAPALSSMYLGKGLGLGTTYVLRKTADKIACRSRPDRMTCAHLQVPAADSKLTADKLLAKLP